MLGDDGRVDPASNVEFCGQTGESRTHAGRQIVQNLIGHRFMERPGLPKRPDVKLQRFQFDTEFLWHIFEVQSREIGLPGFWAKTGKFRDSNSDGVVAVGIRIREIFERIPAGTSAIVRQCIGSLSAENENRAAGVFTLH